MQKQSHWERYHKAQYLERKSLGLCTKCSAKAITGKTYCAECKKIDQELHKKYWENRRKNNLCLFCGDAKEIKGKSCQECKTKFKNRRDLYISMALEAYGNKCVCCGEAEKIFLTIDHINNDGAEHKRNVGKHIYKWLKDNNYPKDNYRLLCYNCNSGRARNKGVCPHEEKRQKGEINQRGNEQNIVSLPLKSPTN